jgi:hypothetical protein
MAFSRVFPGGGGGSSNIASPAVGATTLTGTAQPNAAVPVYKGSSTTPIGTAFADASGNWSLTLGTATALNDVYRTTGNGIVVGVILNALTVSATSATVGSAFTATISGLTSGSTPSLSGAGAAGLSISGSTISGTPTAAGSVDIIETLSTATNSPRTTSAAISVSASGAGPTLGTLSISPNTATIGTPYTGTISGATAGSTIVLDSLTVTGTGTTRSVTGTPQGSAGSWPATETLSGATNSPNTTNNVLTVAAAVAGPALRLIMWGQSNTQALGTATTANGGFNAAQVMPTGYTGPNARVKIWGTSNAFETYQPYVNSEQGDNAGTTWGSEWGIASAWLNDNPTGTVYIVKHAIGSTGIAPGSSTRYWAPSGGSGQLYSILTNKVTAAAAALSAAGVTINAANTVVVQSQGEQDAKTTTDAGNYQTNLNTLIAQARTDWTASRWIIERLHVEMTLNGFPAWATVYAAQGSIITADQNVELVSTDGLPLADGLHFTAASVDAKGIRTGATVQRWWTKAPFTGLTNVADVNNDRYARATTAGDLTTMKSCLSSDSLAVATTATTQRTYIDVTGVRRNNLAANVLRFDFTGGKRRLVHEAQAQNAVLYGRDLTNAAWTATNITAVKDQTGLDAVANSASRITATAAAGTITQAITAASAVRICSVDVMRLVGTGTLEMTQDGGATYTVLTVTSGITRVAIPSQTLTNPTIGFRIATSGDSFLIDAVQCEVGAFATSPIYTAGSATTRPAEKVTPAVLTDALQTAGAFVYRGRLAPATAATFIGGDGGNAILGRTAVATRVMSMNGTVSLSADTTGTPYTGSFGVAVTFDATGRSLSINGSALGTDTNVVRTTATGVTIGAGSSTNALSQTGGTCDLVGWGPTLVAGTVVQALAVANP